jgi:hypothetical protein
MPGGLLNAVLFPISEQSVNGSNSWRQNDRTASITMTATEKVLTIYGCRVEAAE